MTKAKRKLRLGMVGGGPGAFIGEVHRKAARLDGRYDIVAGVFSSNFEKSKQTGAELNISPSRIYATYDEMIAKEKALPVGERIDVVSIVTPNHLHFGPAKAALEAGFHVICDKPLAFDMKEGKDLKSIVEKTKKVFGLTHNYSGYPMVKEAKHLVKTGKIGKILKVVVEYPQGWLLNNLEKDGQKQAAWRTDPKQAGASCCMGDIGTHCEHLAKYITGLEIAEVCAELTAYRSGRQLDDDGNVLLRYHGGAKGILHASQISFGEENGLNIRVYGEKGRIYWKQELPTQLWVQFEGGHYQLMTPGNDYLSPIAKKACRIPAGHPEAFLEAFANIYVNVADTILKVDAGEKPDELDLDFPTVDDGIAGLAFIQSVVENGFQDKVKWTKIPH
jgi:predicted dehydrogenase